MSVATTYDGSEVDMVAKVQQELLSVVERLKDSEQARVLAFARAVAQHKLPLGASGAALKGFLEREGPIGDDAARVMLAASAECRLVDPRGW